MLDKFSSNYVNKMKNRFARKSAFKFQKFNKQKAQYNLSKKSSSFKTHTVVQSNAEIMLPGDFQFNQLEHLIAMITCNDVVFWAQISENSFTDKNLEQISILQNLINLTGLQIQGGYFQGQIKFIQKTKIPEDYYLQYAQIIVKNVYLSRRDQYKIMQYLAEKPLHTYNRKTMYFHKLKLDFNNFINKKGMIAKSGIIDKNTKLIFRTTCSKYTILVQISEEIFQLNQQKQLYFQKAIQFLTVFFLRNNFFQTNHRIEIVLFARVFYPQFQTLSEAYQNLKFNQDDKNSYFATNFASALQKNHDGLIYQDFYRRILWRNNESSDFRHIFSFKVSQFVFSMNIKDSESYSKYISKGINETIFQSEKLSQNPILKPYVHRFSGELSKSQDSCFFQAISLISEQFKHHYIFRSLEQTGNTIMLLTAGKSIYNTDMTTYKMAKSNIYLTNIHSLAINLRRKDFQLSVRIACLKNKPLFQKNQAQKLYRLVDWCQELDAYQTPTSIKQYFPQEKFQMKSKIYPQNLIQISSNQVQDILKHKCQKNHIKNVELKNHKFDYHIQVKQIQWIKTVYVNGMSYKAHNIFYEHLSFDWLKFTSKKHQDQDLQLTDFERDLRIISNKKRKYNLENICIKSQNQTTLKAYIKQLAHIKDSQLKKQQQIIDEESYIGKLFQISVCSRNMVSKQPVKNMRKLSKEDIVQEFDGYPESPKSYKAQRLFRKSFDEARQSIFIPGRVTNILEETFRRGGYQKANHINIDFIQSHKSLSHNKQRQKKNYPSSPIHFMMTYFNEDTIRKLNHFINIQKQGKYWKVDQKFINGWFVVEKQWKDIIFPLLTPIYTSFTKKEDETAQKWQKRDAKHSKFGEFAIEDEICKYLMENFQIQQASSQYLINLSKGHVRVSLYASSPGNVMTFQNIDTKRQGQIIPKLLYRYLSFEEKDSRFGAKSIAFQDANFYLQEVSHPKKSVKLTLISKNTNGETDLTFFQDFINCLSEKYPVIKLSLQLNKNKTQISKIYTQSIDLVQNMKNSIYRSEIIEIKIDKSYHPQSLFNFVIQWQYCCAVYINQFINTIVSLAWKNKIITHRVSKAHAFNNFWNMSTIGQIVFESQLGMQLLQKKLIKQKLWLWDYEGYYMDKNGNAFIRFIHEKKLIEWKDNNMDKQKWRNHEKKEDFLSFFLLSNTYDMLGNILDSITY